MPEPRIVAMVLAGGEGMRLMPLTAERSKPAVPFGGRYRIVDFVLSNLVNSGVNSIYMLVQYKSQSLIEHIRNGWVLAPILPSHFITVVPPQMREGPEWFQGTADAVYQNMNLIEPNAPDLVAIFGADHIYRMDVRAMARFHRERSADVTISALPVPISESNRFGVIVTDAEGRVTDFQEKPSRPKPMAGSSDHVFASMGNYIFSTDVLLGAVRRGCEAGDKDFGRHVLPRLMGTHRVFAYDFSTNVIPGLRDYEERAYWRDVGSIETYYASNMDTLGLEPRLNLFNPRWPILSRDYQGPIAHIVKANVENSVIAAGSLVHDATIKGSLIRREVVIEEDVIIEDSIIMDYSVVRRGARIRRSIVDRYNTIDASDRLGYDIESDRKRHHVSKSGIVVVGKAPFRADTRRNW
ncbi:MAG TPA: glucose-1-phosphate adenylyltransferase [Casimicrobiaceae bacterium]|nr:glucose-1-phosphate adenylyltransferase [Casimicrobiaceae bacterium]